LPTRGNVNGQAPLVGGTLGFNKMERPSAPGASAATTTDDT